MRAEITTELKAQNSELKAQNSELKALSQQVILTQYAATHALSKTSEDRVKAGSVFVVLEGDADIPLCCGFFVGPRTAITVCHDEFFTRQKTPFDVRAIASSTGESLQLSCELIDTDFDYAILRLTSKRLHGDAFFELPAHSTVVPGLSLALVNMGVGLKLYHEVPLSYGVHAVTVSSCHGASFYYDGASTWGGDSGAALLFEEGCVVGMHQEVLDDKPEVSPSAGLAGAGSKRSRDVRDRVSLMEEAFEKVSEASSSLSKSCKALLLSHIYSVVQAEIEKHNR